MMEDLRDQWEWLILQWEYVARKEAAFLFHVQQRRDDLPILRPLRLVSSWHPLRDITVLVWIAFIVSLPFIGYKLCFEFMSVAIVTFGVNWVCGVRCPGDLDGRIRQLSRISPYVVVLSASILDVAQPLCPRLQVWVPQHGNRHGCCDRHFHGGGIRRGLGLDGWIRCSVVLLLHSHLCCRLPPTPACVLMDMGRWWPCVGEVPHTPHLQEACA